MTARKAAKRGARLVLAARSEDALRRLTDEIKGGGQAVYVAADVSKQDDVRRIAQEAQDAFGGFDTWVNNAGMFIYGKLEETPSRTCGSCSRPISGASSTDHSKPRST